VHYMRNYLLLFVIFSIGGCFFQEREHAVAAPAQHSSDSKLEELQGKVQIKGFALFLIKPDGKQIELNTDKIVDSPVMIHGTTLKDGKFQVTDLKGG
jgi:hypothetical protein